MTRYAPRLAAWTLAPLLALAPLHALAAPPAYKLINAAEDYLKAVKGASGTLRLEGADLPAALAWAAASSDAPPTLPFEVERDKRFALGATSLDFKDLHLRRTPPALRVLAAALGGGKLNTTAKRLGGKLPNEVITLDRLDNRLVWALGDDGAAVWLDRDLHRPVRYHYGPGVIDDDAWTARLTYDDAGPLKGWFPNTVTIYRDKDPQAALRATVSATLR